jgi:4-amino-4-deoxy-L-arabinose transferase-like glycosyltransferase
MVAAAAALAALLIPPARTAAMLVGADSVLLSDVTAGVWIFKAMLLAHAIGLAWLASWLSRQPDAPPLLDLSPLNAGSFRHPAFMLLAILTLALALRLVDLGAGLWHDEIATLVEYGQRPIGEIIATYGSQNQHPLYSVLARGSIAIFGAGAWALRLPAVLLGVASLGALYWFGTRVVAQREAFLATLLLAVSYHHIWFSQNARGYTGLMLLTVLGSGLFLKLLDGQARGRWITVLGYAACMALAVWTHLTAAFVLAAHLIVWAVLAVRRPGQIGEAMWTPIIAMVLAGTFAFQLYALVLPQLRETLFEPKAEFGDTPWRSPLWLIAETVRGASRGLPGGWVGLAAGAMVALLGIVSLARRSGPVAAVLVLPVVLTAGALTLVSHNLWPRFFFFAAGFAVLIAVRGVFAALESVEPRRGASVATALLLLAAIGSGLTVSQAWGAKQDYEGALAHVTTARSPEEPLVATGLALFAMEDYLHAPGVRAVRSEEELLAAEAAGDRTWLIYSFPTHLAAAEPEVWARIQREYRRVAEFPGTLAGGTVYLMSRP